eukprot:CAMPEP_0115067308 /NCGR_PEP_ID=MMETSP0227-20121206/11315_1 /TAXON_ID=89957 /ORGANISM="Polarella glacialis, Strain CCMP 1383" /LENGTH=1121 /DNA_ID=CAMNT_0002453355 /DNA_START=49 /DNA_END=3414 /DNA_ORIENTATION=+
MWLLASWASTLILFLSVGASGRQFVASPTEEAAEEQVVANPPEEVAEEAGELVTRTFDWDGSQEVSSRLHQMGDEPKEDAAKPPPRQLDEALQARRVEALAPGQGQSAFGGNLLDSLWDRQEYRRARFNLTADPGEHSCFSGFKSMFRNTNRCQGWQREYPAQGGNQTFLNTGQVRYASFTLAEVVGDHINVWLEDDSSDLHRSVTIKAAQIYANTLGVKELQPVAESKSWMDHQCKVFGAMPFMYTCSDRINILVQKCGMSNAWVIPSDFLHNYPKPADNTSQANFDIVFYMCQELIDQNPNPYSAATTFAHELAHVIQGGFGHSFYPMIEGGATWLEGSLLRLPPRPMCFGWGFQDWNEILAAHIYATTKPENARKFYQIHAMLLTYLSQKELLGDAATSSLQNYETFDSVNIPWGRGAYDYFLANLGKGSPSRFSPVQLDVADVFHPFGTVLLDFRIAMAAQCIAEEARRPSEVRYLMPAHLRDQPFWDCSTFQTFWSSSNSSDPDAMNVTFVDSASSQLHYGGAAIFRLAMPQGATISVAANADPRIRTKVLAAGDSSGAFAAEVRELRPGGNTTFGGGARELFVVQVNVDPEGETVSLHDAKGLWKRSSYGCSQGCRGQAWTNAVANESYPPNARTSLRSRLVRLPNTTNVSLHFLAKWHLEAEISDNETLLGCGIRGYDGVQIRVHVYHDADAATSSSHKDGYKVKVLQPDGGYGHLAGGQKALGAFINADLLVPLANHTCDDLAGYTGKSAPGGFHWQNFTLAAEAGLTVRIEVIFSSDGSEAFEGFWLTNFEIQADGVVLLSDAADVDQAANNSLYEHHILASPTAGSVGKYDGIPVAVQYPEGYKADLGVSKKKLTISAPWSARWSESPTDPVAAQPRAYLGWSYSAPSSNVATARLHPWQEACLQLEAPFPGHLDTATLFALVDKVGIGVVTLVARSAIPPYADLGGGAVKSASEGVSDPGAHRFRLGAKWGPELQKGEAFFLCVGTGEVKSLQYDGEGLQPFLHLPLTEVNSSGNVGKTGWTVLRGNSTNVENVSDPWQGHTLSLRAEFMHSLPATTTTTPAAAAVAAAAVAAAAATTETQALSGAAGLRALTVAAAVLAAVSETAHRNS